MLGGDGISETELHYIEIICIHYCNN